VVRLKADLEAAEAERRRLTASLAAAEDARNAANQVQRLVAVRLM
jgi:hypothetical protein